MKMVRDGAFTVDHLPSLGGGFSMTFESGYTVSVAFNRLTKCVNLEVDQTKASADGAEVLVWDADGEIVVFDGMTERQPSHSFKTPDEVLDILKRAAEGSL